MAGSQTLVRVGGIPDGGFPSEIDASVKIRWVDDLLTNMSERSADLLRYLGGPASFEFNNTKIEWVEDDIWNRRPSLGATPLTNGADTSLSLATGTGHRYPVGTILFVAKAAASGGTGEYMRITATAADAVTVTRDVTSAVTETAIAQTDEVIVAGFSMHENDAWVARPAAIFSLPFNYAQVQHVAADVTYRRQETALYGLRGTDLDKVAADTTAEQFVAIEQAAAFGARFIGDATSPAMYGGFRQYINSTDAQVTDLSGAALTRKDIDDTFEELYYSVGGDKMAMTLLVSSWAKRKITSFFSAAERLPPLASEAGVAIDRFKTEWGSVDVLLHTALAKDEMYFIRRENHRIGHHGQRGRPHLEEGIGQLAATGLTGPFVRRVFYADLSMINSGPQAEGRIHNFSTSA